MSRFEPLTAEERATLDKAVEQYEERDRRLHLILSRVWSERKRQDERWGPPEDRRHLTFPDLVTILTEEVGELAEAVLERRFGGSQSSQKGLDPHEEAVQAAAVAVAIAEHLLIEERADAHQERAERRPTEGEDDG